MPKKYQVRIISGKWRRRLLRFPQDVAVRPTPDRIRETLFNWLASHINGANCLDCFAGSGALGFEAASRGAKHVTMIEQDRRVMTALNENKKILYADNVDIIHARCPDRVPILTTAPFDIVFLDPPFHQNLIIPTVDWLVEQSYLSPSTFIYIETEKSAMPLALPSNWVCWRSERTKALSYGVYTMQPHLMESQR